MERSANPFFHHARLDSGDLAQSDPIEKGWGRSLMNRIAPRISIVTPSYNQARFLEKTIRSVLDQEYPNLEYIVMDGGSDDGSVEILRRYSNRLTYWRSSRDDGQADAIKRGFTLATGDILGWVNSDDLLLPGSLEHVAHQFRQHRGADFLAGGFVPIDENGRATWCFWPSHPHL